MPRIDQQEGETLEFKRQWTDRALEDLAALANTRGGTLLVGIRDDGEIVGTTVDDREVQRITNLIASHLGVTPSIQVVDMKGRPVIEIQVEPAAGLVSYGGRYLRRVGTTNRDYSPDELARHILERSGRTWDGLPSEWGLDEVNREALANFARLARPKLPYLDAENPEQTLQNLDLLSDGRLKNAAVLLFGKRPQRLFPLAQVRVGLFRGNEILDSHDFQGTLWQQLEGVMERFRQVLKVRFEIKVEEPTLEGLRRKEVWEYPLEALREAVVNALIHRDYTYPADIQIRLEEGRLEVWSPGELPPPLTPEALYGPHSSVLRNPLIAQAFYFAGVIERWGTGTTRIIRLCHEQGFLEPEFAHWQGGLRVTFLQDPYTLERLRALGLNERQIQAVLYVKEHGKITNREFRAFTGVSDEGARLDLKRLVELGILKPRGKGRSAYYALRRVGD
ncbi:ATP-binding protein [Methanothrix thermoacetophila]|uniref:Putative transcriptional regulator n=1 Tax=Methanothrix thermoacetophila (strain DSM 6194 / JCM 14653 / NBRC 101360 / PT) TaxID=349307 RepID=A0B8G6_METTP|nr:ATP-binding protein [Methanothrix thermoacetophila]ABK14990.1 putative transcriptional regulator [Methanothrix thermoacetophila PT]